MGDHGVSTSADCKKKERKEVKNFGWVPSRTKLPSRGHNSQSGNRGDEGISKERLAVQLQCLVWVSRQASGDGVWTQEHSFRIEVWVRTGDVTGSRTSVYADLYTLPLLKR